MMKYTTISELLAQYPFLHDFFQQHRLDVSKAMNQTIGEYIEHISEEEAEEKAIHKENLFEEMKEYIAQIQSFLGIEEEERVHSLTILPGQTKYGEPEQFGELTIAASQIVSIVGPTGSGKSRLLADIEWAAQGDTPTKRRILINGAKPDTKWRFSFSSSVVSKTSWIPPFLMTIRWSAIKASKGSCVAINTILSSDTNNLNAFSLSIPAFSISSIKTIGEALKIAVSAIINALD